MYTPRQIPQQPPNQEIHTNTHTWSANASISALSGWPGSGTNAAVPPASSSRLPSGRLAATVRPSACHVTTTPGSGDTLRPDGEATMGGSPSNSTLHWPLDVEEMRVPSESWSSVVPCGAVHAIQYVSACVFELQSCTTAHGAGQRVDGSAASANCNPAGSRLPYVNYSARLFLPRGNNICTTARCCTNE